MELKPAAPRVTADSARFMSALNSLGSGEFPHIHTPPSRF